MKCEVCGNDYDKVFVVEMGGARHTFDSFECAIHALAPSMHWRRPALIAAAMWWDMASSKMARSFAAPTALTKQARWN